MKSLRVVTVIATTLLLTTGPAAAEPPPTGRDQKVTILSDKAEETFTEAANVAEATGARDITWTSSSGWKISVQGLLPGSTVRLHHATAPPSDSRAPERAAPKGVSLSITGPTLSKSELLKYAGSGPDRPADLENSAAAVPGQYPDWTLSLSLRSPNGHGEVNAYWGAYLVYTNGGNWGLLGDMFHSGRDLVAGTEIKRLWQQSRFPVDNFISQMNPTWSVDFPSCRTDTYSVSAFGYTLARAINNCVGRIDPWFWYNQPDSGVEVAWVGNSGWRTVGAANTYSVWSPSNASWGLYCWIGIVDY